MGYLRNAFKLSQTQRRLMLGLVLILVLTSNRVLAAEACPAPDAASGAVAQMDIQDTKTVGFTVPGMATNQLPESSDAPAARSFSITLTAYTSEASETDSTPFIAADGTHVYDGMIAANFLKFNTRVRIPELFGNKVFTVHDRMNQRFTDRMDVWMVSKELAKTFGIKHAIKVEVL